MEKSSREVRQIPKGIKGEYDKEGFFVLPDGCKTGGIIFSVL